MHFGEEGPGRAHWSELGGLSLDRGGKAFGAGLCGVLGVCGREIEREGDGGMSFGESDNG